MREFFLNPDFDRTLAGGKYPPETGDAAILREMPWHFLPAADQGDTVIVHAPLPAGFRAYADAKGLALPGTILHPGFTPDAEFVPFGWNAQASALAGRYLEPSRGPDPAVVKAANSRAFALELERRRQDCGYGGRLLTGYSGLEDFLANRPPSEDWVVKGEHGFAGTGNIRVSGGGPAAADGPRLEALFAAHGRAVVEPWHERVQDMAVLFTTGPDGTVGGFRGHILNNSRDGAFLGVEVAADRLPPPEWRDGLRENAEIAARALADLGYAGPVGIDAYTHRVGGETRLRPLVDVNARLSMALPAHGLASRLPGRRLRWSWHKTGKLRLPDSYPDLERRLGASAFDPGRGTGILAVSPLFREDGSGSKPKRISFALVADSAEGLQGLQAEFARALGRGT